PAQSAHALQHVDALLAGFYTDILAGDGIDGHHLDAGSSRFDRAAVLGAFLRANETASGCRVCPGCDGCPPAVADGIPSADIDHFFPKARYPFLALHVLNLTPYCKTCNQD